MKRRLFVAAGVAAALTGVAACGSSGSSKSSASGSPAAGSGKTVTAWFMKGSLPDDMIAQLKSDFAAKHPGETLDVEIQQWNGIGDKIKGALASNSAPDLMEVGNTQVAEYAGSGGVQDLSDKVDALGGKDWLPALSGPGNIGGKQYGVPFYAANRVVIYNKDMFAAAGIQSPPKTRDEWLQDTQKLNTGGQQGIYLPGRNWYAYAGFLWDEGGDLATQSGGQWQAGLDTPQAVAAANFFKQLQALGNGPKDGDEATPQETDVIAAPDAKVAQWIATPSEAATVEKNNPALNGKFGFFPIPGKTADKPGAVFAGGSDLIVPVAAKHQTEAMDLLTDITSDAFQVKLANEAGYVPAKVTQAPLLDKTDEGLQAMVTAGSQNGHSTPTTANWAAVEANNPIKDYLTSVLTGTDPATAGKTAADAINKTLNSSS